MTAILEALKASRLLPPHAFRLDGEAAPPRATRQALERFHTKKHVDKVYLRERGTKQPPEECMSCLLMCALTTPPFRPSTHPPIHPYLPSTPPPPHPPTHPPTQLFALFRQSAHLLASGQGSGVREIDGDTAVMPGTEEAALRAAGAVRELVLYLKSLTTDPLIFLFLTTHTHHQPIHPSIHPSIHPPTNQPITHSTNPPPHPQTCTAVDRVLSGEAPAAFCVVRPPGHHATPSQAMGFCFFSNAGVAALHARAVHGLQRVACVDVVRGVVWCGVIWWWR